MDHPPHIRGPVGVGRVFDSYIFCLRISILSAFYADPQTKSHRQTTLRFFRKNGNWEPAVFLLRHLDQLLTYFEGWWPIFGCRAFPVVKTGANPRTKSRDPRTKYQIRGQNTTAPGGAARAPQRFQNLWLVILQSRAMYFYGKKD